MSHSANSERARRIIGAVAVLALAIAAWATWSLMAGKNAKPAEAKAFSRTTVPVPQTGASPVHPPSAVLFPRSDQTVLVRRQRITGNLSPKSVAASATGLVTAQNMMYTHTVSVFTPDGKLKATVGDSVDLARFGIEGHPGTSKGAPVEAAFTHDGKHLYVSNYAMYGEGFGPEGQDSCRPASAPDKSVLYRINITTMRIDQVIPVGAVPKYVAVTPDDSTVLVTNWCSWTLSVVDVKTARVVETIPMHGDYPRGIAISPDSRTAFVAMMGSRRIDRVDLATRKVSTFVHTGSGPRHIVISPDGRYLYVTNSGSGTVEKVDAGDGRVLATVATGKEPRSMAISSDGLAVYVVNYDSSTVSKLRTSDLKEIARKATDEHPIGIAYEPTTRSVWVACYGGSIIVLDDSKPAKPGPDATGQPRVK